MISRYENRTRAYRYIVEQAKKINWDLTPTSDRTVADNCNISLDELVGLKEGFSDPSQEVVVALKKILRRVTSEAEIDKYLVKPFLPTNNLYSTVRVLSHLVEKTL